jgi:hypothetical protein
MNAPMVAKNACLHLKQKIAGVCTNANGVHFT